MSTDVTQSTSTLSQKVAEEIRAMMARRRISGAALARALGKSTAWVSYRLTGTQPIDLDDLDRIAAILEVEAADLMPRNSGRLITASSPLADHRTGTNARSSRPTERPTLTGQRKRAEVRESTRRPARVVPMIPALMTDDVMAELLDPQAA